MYLPATGERVYNTGQISQQGWNAHYWSSSTYGTSNGYNLLIESSNVYPSHYFNYAIGFPVRCVR